MPCAPSSPRPPAPAAGRQPRRFRLAALVSLCWALVLLLWAPAAGLALEADPGDTFAVPLNPGSELEIAMPELQLFDNPAAAEQDELLPSLAPAPSLGLDGGGTAFGE